MSAVWTVDRRLCLTVDKKRAVEETDPAAHTLWAIPGEVVSRAEAERLGAVAPEPESESEGDDQAEEKAAAPAPNKARRRAPNKSGSDG